LLVKAGIPSIEPLQRHRLIDRDGDDCARPLRGHFSTLFADATLTVFEGFDGIRWGDGRGIQGRADSAQAPRGQGR